MKRKILALALAIVLAVPVMVSIDSDTVSAATVQEKINAATKEKQAALDKIKNAEAAKDDVIAQSEQLEREIDLIQSEIYTIDDIIAEIDAEIAEKEEEIKKYEEDIAAQDQKLKACLRAMDENSMTSYLDLLLSSESFTSSSPCLPCAIARASAWLSRFSSITAFAASTSVFKSVIS